MTCEFRTLLVVTACFASSLVDCGTGEAPGPAVIEQKAGAVVEQRTETIVEQKNEPVIEPDEAPNENPHNMFLLEPAVSGLNVEINGAVDSKAGASQILWNWGDDTPEAHSWFPAKHLYEKSGTYEVRVTSHDEAGNTSTRTTTVKIPPEG